MNRVVIAFSVVVLAAACGGPDAEASLEPVATPPADSCIGIPTAKCEELIASTKVDLGESSVRSVHVTCVRAPCTNRTGDSTIEVVLVDGRRLSFGSSWHTAGDPEPLPLPSLGFEPVCVGLDANHCTARVLEAVNGHPNEPGITGLDIRCVGTCTPNGGQGRTVISFSGGGSATEEWAYGPSG